MHESDISMKRSTRQSRVMASMVMKFFLFFRLYFSLLSLSKMLVTVVEIIRRDGCHEEGVSYDKWR